MTAATSSSAWRQYYALTKPRVVQLIVFCALIGMVLAVPGAPKAPELLLGLWACIGIWLVAGAAAAFNCLVEKTIDSKMKRTAWRPTAKGELSDRQALLFSAALCAVGSAILYVMVNPLTMWLTFATFVGYAIIYTVILKPLTPQNIVIGGASGAMPPVLGWAAMTGDVGPEALILFLIIFLWTPPHFWALALYRVHRGADGRLPDALCVRHEFLALSGRGRGLEHWLHRLCRRLVPCLFRRIGAQDFPFFPDSPECLVCRAAGGPLPFLSV